MMVPFVHEHVVRGRLMRNIGALTNEVADDSPVPRPNSNSSYDSIVVMTA